MIVLRAGIAVRLVAFLVLWLLALSPRLPQGWPAQGLFLLVVLAWSALSVASTTLAAEMNTGAGNEGEGIGLFNAVSALSGVVGSAAAGWTAATWGFRAIPAVAVAGSAAGLLIMLAGRFRGRFR